MSRMPRAMWSIVIIIGGLALFLVIASLGLISHPITSNVIHSYFNPFKPLVSVNGVRSETGVKGVREEVVGEVSDGYTPGLSGVDSSGSDKKGVVESESGKGEGSGTGEVLRNGPRNIGDSGKASEVVVPVVLPSGLEKELGGLGKPEVRSEAKEVEVGNSGRREVLPSENKKVEVPSERKNGELENLVKQEELWSEPKQVESGSCDLYHGKWFYDSAGPLYTNNSCPVITQMQNCQGNGRPDKDYENYRWKPTDCDLPRFDPKKFLELMRGKTLAFIGDSVGRNQMESMLCILWQVEAPKNRGNKKMQRWLFPSTKTMIVRIWSSWLVHKTSAPFDFATGDVVKLHLDAPDENFFEYLPSFDVIVLSSGHWFAKQSVYINKNEIVGGQLWWPDNSRPKKIGSVEAFGISVETILTAIGTYPNYTGLVIVRSYSPDHYKGGAWNTGGSCTGKTKPASDAELVKNGNTDNMHAQQVMGFNNAVKKITNKSRLKLMDITKSYQYRHDGHPGPYRNPDPNKKTKRGPNGEPPPQDCLHWCMPGPVDTWNELVHEIIRRDLEGFENSPA